MGLLRSWFTGSTDPVLSAALEAVKEPEHRSGPRFEVSIDPVMLYGAGVSPATTVPLSPRVSRREAMSVPAVKRARDLIAGTLGSLPLNLISPDNTVTDWALFTQPETDVPRSVTMTQTFEDVLFEGVAWWKVDYVGWHGKPVSVRRLDPRSVTVLQDARVYQTVAGNQGTSQQWIPDEQLIRFDSPNDPLLVAGARAIRACLALDAAALRHADGAPPLDYFTPADGADLGDDDEVVAMLNQWQTARQARSTGYVPAALKYNVAGWNPEQLQMAEARQHAVLEVARLAGVDPEELGVSTTSRTYNNAQDRVRAFVNGTLGGYLRAVEDRLSMPDVTPRGYLARMNLSDLLKSDDATRVQVASAAITSGVLTRAEARAYFDPTLPAGAPDARAQGTDGARVDTRALTPAEETANA